MSESPCTMRAITRFGQWWRRTLRGGYAFAEGAFLHGDAPEQHRRRESRRAWFWGLGVPLVTIIARLLQGWPGLLLLLVYPLQVVRLARRGAGRRGNWLLAFSSCWGNFPRCLGRSSFY